MNSPLASKPNGQPTPPAIKLTSKMQITNKLGTNGFNLPMNNSLPLKVSPLLSLEIYHIKHKGFTFYTSIPSLPNYLYQHAN